MPRFVAMLRSVNVGGRNRLAMADLRALVSPLGFGEVTTYVQSGNVVFSGPGSDSAVARAIGARMAADLGLAVPVLVRTAAQLRTVLGRQPLRRRCRRSEDDPRHIPGRSPADGHGGGAGGDWPASSARTGSRSATEQSTSTARAATARPS